VETGIHPKIYVPHSQEKRQSKIAILSTAIAFEKETTKKPGFSEDFGGVTDMLQRNPVSESLVSKSLVSEFNPSADFSHILSTPDSG
jgi:hypothetical protein